MHKPGCQYFEREVVSNSAASSVGIKVRDIITHFDGEKLTEENTLTKLIRGKRVRESVKLRIFRNGSTIDLTAILKEAPSE